MTTPSVFTPPIAYIEALKRACQVWGVQEEYWDIWGKQHIAPADTLSAVLKSIGVPAESLETLNQVLEEQAWEEWSRPVPPTLVLQLRNATIPVQTPLHEKVREVRLRFRWEDGSSEEASYPLAGRAADGTMTIRGTSFERFLLPLPAKAGLGYHQVTAICGDQQCHATLILCPDRAFKPALLEQGNKTAGIAISLYGLKSDRNWGCGDFSDLVRFTDWVADDTGASFVALNPLHSIPNRQPYNTSPYLPNCSFYRNPLYLDVEALEDFRASALAQKLFATEQVQQQLTALRESSHVEYEQVYKLKYFFLKLAFRQFLREYRQKSPRAQAFDRFIDAEGSLLKKYAVYCALDTTLHRQNQNLWIWPDWPTEFQDPNSNATRQFEAKHHLRVLFHMYLQWQVDVQLEAAQKHAVQKLPIGLYHDLALATDSCGSDLWAHSSFYVKGCRVGSPPDGFSPEGQDWAFPPPNALAHKADGYRMFAESIRKNCKHGGALRIDHVMRFFRLFWIPEGKDASGGVYVREVAEDLLAILALESVRNQVIVIGEDLGTVEPYIREALHKFGVLSYRLLYFERYENGGFKPPHEYPRQALVSVSTHDLPTLAGFWESRDIEARREAGVLPDEASYQQQKQERTKEKQNLIDILHSLRLLPSDFPRDARSMPTFAPELHNAVIGFLASTPSEILVINQEDIFKDPDQQNLPGTTTQYPNWRHKMALNLEELRTNQTAIGCTAMFRHWLQRTGRENQKPTN